jgi:prephenate dehydratase
MSILALGPAGTNGHEAAERLKKNYQQLDGNGIKFCRRNRDILAGVDAGEAEYGVVPVENNTKGHILEVIKYWLKQSPDEDERSLYVIGEIVVPIRHCLMAAAGLEIKDLKYVSSHPEALDQCTQHLADLNLDDRRPAVSTAASAEDAAKNADKGAAAIAPELAAKIYGLNILREDMQDENGNATRFHLLGRESASAEPTCNDRTAIMFWTRDEIGSLWQALGPIAMAKVNMTAIYSIPLGKEESYAFYAELQGHRKDPMVSSALAMLRQNHTEKLIVMGSYPRANGNSVTHSTYPPKNT